MTAEIDVLQLHQLTIFAMAAKKFGISLEKLALVAMVSCGASVPFVPVNAQDIVGDSTLSKDAPTVATSSDGLHYSVTGGVNVGGKNLYHSFSNFNIPSGGSVTFTADGNDCFDCTSIFARIMQGTHSNLGGSLYVDTTSSKGFSGNPALYLMNPFGFVLETGFSSQSAAKLFFIAADGIILSPSSSGGGCGEVGACLYFDFKNYNDTQLPLGYFDGSYISERASEKYILIKASNLVASDLSFSAAKINFDTGSTINVENLNIYAQWFSSNGENYGAIAGDGQFPSSLKFGTFRLYGDNSAQFYPATSIIATGQTGSGSFLLTRESLYVPNSTSSLTIGDIRFGGVINSPTTGMLAQKAYVSTQSTANGSTSPWGAYATTSSSSSALSYNGIYYGFSSIIYIDNSLLPIYSSSIESLQKIVETQESPAELLISTEAAKSEFNFIPAEASVIASDNLTLDLSLTALGSSSPDNNQSSSSNATPGSAAASAESSDQLVNSSSDASISQQQSKESASIEQTSSPQQVDQESSTANNVSDAATKTSSPTAGTDQKSDNESDNVNRADPAAPSGSKNAGTPPLNPTASSQEVVSMFIPAEQSNAQQASAALGVPMAQALTPQQAQSALRQALDSVRYLLQQQGAGKTDKSSILGPIKFVLDDTNLLASAPAGPGVMPQFFNRAAYLPAILQIRFTEAKGRTSSSAADAFLDLTLIPPEGEIVGKRVELSMSTFVSLLRELYSQLSRQENLRVNDLTSPARRLYQFLLAPLESDLTAAGITTLLIGAERGLQGVPYAALHSGKTFFGEQYAFSLTPSLSLTDLKTVQPSGGKLLAAGASQFDGLAPLPLVPQELDAISSTQPADRLLNGSFTRATIEETAADPTYSRIHLATHAEFLPGGTSKSKLYSGTGPVPLTSLGQLRRNRQGIPIDLISFSACRTALGDLDSELGFAGLALQAGARSAIGTLWYVDDVATSAYFIQAYRYLQQGLPKAEALQFTRRDFASGRVQISGDQLLAPDGHVLLSGLTTAQQRRIVGGVTNPYYWAGIELLGSPW